MMVANVLDLVRSHLASHVSTHALLGVADAPAAAGRIIWQRGEELSGAQIHLRISGIQRAHPRAGGAGTATPRATYRIDLWACFAPISGTGEAVERDAINRWDAVCEHLEQFQPVGLALDQIAPPEIIADDESSDLNGLYEAGIQMTLTVP